MFDWNKAKVIAVVGHTGSGKTASCYNIMDSMKGRSKYIVDHPFPEALAGTGIENIPNVNFEDVCDSAVWIDEPQLVFPKGEKKSNDALMMMCSLARQRDVTLMFSTSDTRWINRGMESYVDTWLIKNLDFNLVKQGSITQKIIKQKYYNIMPSSFRLENSEGILYSPSQLERPVKVNIPLPRYWSEKLSKPYKFSTQKISEVFGNVCENSI
jgi:hypothetical protein